MPVEAADDDAGTPVEGEEAEASFDGFPVAPIASKPPLGEDVFGRAPMTGGAARDDAKPTRPLGEDDDMCG